MVLFNLGGPDSVDSVRPFLFNLFNDKAIIGLPQPFRWLLAKLISTLRSKTARRIYAQMGGSSPLLAETNAQASALHHRLSRQFPNDVVRVEIAMRYWHPFTKDAAGRVSAFKPDDIVLAPLYPQFSTTTTGSSIGAWSKAYKGGGGLHAICCYPDQADFIQAHAERIQEMLAQAPKGPIRVLFSAHGLPEKIVQAGDPYQQQIELSARTLAEQLNLSDWQVCYQSRVGPMAWIGPSTIEALQRAGRDGIGVLVVPIAFVSEHSETLVELDLDYRELASKAGVPFYLRARTIGVHPSYIEALAKMVVSALATLGVEPQGAPCCGTVAQCPYQAQRRT